MIEAHYRKNFDKLVNFYSKAVGRPNAEDVVQEAYVLALTYQKELAGEDFDRWFNGILKNSLRKFFKDNRRRGITLTEYENFINTGELQTCSPEEFLLCKEKAKEILPLIEEYDGYRRDILTLFFVKNLPYVDIYAVIPNVSRNYIAKTVQLFRQRLKEIF